MARTILTSGKNEGIGGTDAFETKSAPNMRILQCRALSEFISILSRDEAACLNIPPEKNIPIEAHP